MSDGRDTRLGAPRLETPPGYSAGMAAPEATEAFLGEVRNVVVAGIRRDGRPHMTTNWFYWDGERFYISTMRSRAKYAIFTRDPRAQLLIDDSTAFRSVVIDGTVESGKR